MKVQTLPKRCAFCNNVLNDGAKRNRLPYLKIIYTQVKKSYVCPNFLPFLEPKSEHFLFHLLHRNFAQLFCLFWSQNGSIFYHLLQSNFAQFFCLFWSQNWSTFYITCYIGILPNFLPFLEPKSEHFLYHLLHRNSHLT